MWPLSPGSPPAFAPHRHDCGGREGIRRNSILPLPRHPHRNHSPARAGRYYFVSVPGHYVSVETSAPRVHSTLPVAPDTTDPGRSILEGRTKLTAADLDQFVGNGGRFRS